MNEVIQKVEDRYNSLSSAQKSIAKYILKYPDKLAVFSINQLAKETNTALSTINLFAKSVGYTGYKDLKYSYKRSELEDNFEKNSLLLPFISVNQEITQKQINDIAQQLISADKIYIFSFQMSQIPAKDFFFRVQKIMTPKFIMSENFIDQLNYAKMVTDNDVALFVSNSGESTEIIDIIDLVLKDKGIQILITNERNSTLGKKVKNVISSQCKDDDPLIFNETPILGRYALFLIFDRLFSAIFERDKKMSIEGIKEQHQLTSKRRKI